ncbi:hypothetical protein [Flindersiella endophytica]
MTTLMFPIGHSLGTYHFEGDSNDHVQQIRYVQQVRLGREIVELSSEEFAVWSIAHGLGEQPDSDAGPWDRARMEGVFEGSTIKDAARVVDDLLGRGLLVEVDVDSPEAAAGFARRHRLLPLHLGLGNSARLRTMFVAGTKERPLVGMTPTLYEMWLWSHLAPNLLAACEEATPGGLIDVLAALHVLLAPSAACLDLAVQEDKR